MSWLYTTFTNIFGASISEATMRVNPKVAVAERNKVQSGHVDVIPAHFGAEVCLGLYEYAGSRH